MLRRLSRLLVFVIVGIFVVPSDQNLIVSGQFQDGNWLWKRIETNFEIQRVELIAEIDFTELFGYPLSFGEIEHSGIQLAVDQYRNVFLLVGQKDQARDIVLVSQKLSGGHSLHFTVQAGEYYAKIDDTVVGIGSADPSNPLDFTPNLLGASEIQKIIVSPQVLSLKVEGSSTKVHWMPAILTAFLSIGLGFCFPRSHKWRNSDRKEKG